MFALLLACTGVSPEVTPPLSTLPVFVGEDTAPPTSTAAPEEREQAKTEQELQSERNPA